MDMTVARWLRIWRRSATWAFENKLLVAVKRAVFCACLWRISESVLWEWRMVAPISSHPYHQQMLQENAWHIIQRPQNKRIWIATGQYPSLKVRRFYCRPSNVASYHGSAISVAMIRCWRSYYKERRMVVVVKEDLVNHGRTTSRNGQASRCHHWCASRMTEVDGQSSQQMHLSEYLNDARASRVLLN